MNGNLKPFGRAKALKPPKAEFMESIIKFGLSEEDAEFQYMKLGEDEIWLSEEYQVNIDYHPRHGFGEETLILHLSIKRIDKQPIHDWRDLQAIKNALVGPEYEAIELYPSSSRTVDGANQFHLWVFVAEGLRKAPQFPIGWDVRSVTSDSGIGGCVQRELHDEGKTI